MPVSAAGHTTSSDAAIKVQLGLLITLVITTVSTLIIVCFGFYTSFGNVQAKLLNVRKNAEVSVTPDSQLVINLLGSSTKPGQETVFGSRRMGVATTSGVSDVPVSVVDWEPETSSGFSVRIQIVARAVPLDIGREDVVCFTLFFLGSRDGDGVTSLMSGSFDQLEQHTNPEPVPLAMPTVDVDPTSNRIAVRILGIACYKVNWGGDIEVLQSAPAQA